MNYPDNVNPNSKDCPWNERDPIIIGCSECGGDGFIIEDDYDLVINKNVCFKCNGSGEIELFDEDL